MILVGIMVWFSRRGKKIETLLPSNSCARFLFSETRNSENTCWYDGMVFKKGEKN